MSLKKIILENGLTIIGEIIPNSKCISLGYFVRTGARDESENIAGISHFLEHMMFKGTSTRSAMDVTYQLGDIGAQANAFTSEESTVYYMTILPEYLNKGIDLLSDMMKSSIDQSEYDMERNVILEEIALYEDRPTFILFESLQREFFKAHPAGNSVIGSNSTISALEREQMVSYHQSRYSPSNMVFVVSGNFDFDYISNLVRSATLDWKDHNVDRLLITPVYESSYKEFLKKDLVGSHLGIAVPGPSVKDEERFVAAVLSTLLGDSSNSRIYWELIDKGLVDNAGFDNQEFEDGGMFIAYASCDPNNLDKVEKTLLSIIDSPLEFTDEQLESAKTKLATRLALQGESTMRRMVSIGLEYLFNKEYFSISDEVRNIKAVRRVDIENLVENYDWSNKTVVRLLGH